MHSKYVLALPLYRQEQELRRLGLPVSRQTMSNWVLTAGERWLLPVYHVLHKELLANEILHADETTLMVLREPERQALADELGEDGIQELAQRYAEAYEGCYDGAELDAYIEEICADAYAGMDRLPEAKTQIIQKAARQAQDAQQAAEENGGTRGPPEKYSIEMTTGNQPFVEVETDILDGVPKEQWVSTVREALRTKFPNGVVVGNNQIHIDKQSRREMTFSRYMQWLYNNDPQTHADKLRATSNADEILRATIDWINEGLNHPRKDQIADFARGNVLLRVGGNDYSADVVVGTRKDGSMLMYDVLNLRKTSFEKREADAAINTNPSPGTVRSTASVSDTSIRSQEQKSQDKFSAAEEAAESDAEAEGTTAFTLDSIPKKAQDYLRRVRGQTAAAIQQTLSMPFAARQEVLKPAIEEMMNEYLQTGRISQETVDRNFEESYRRGVKRPTVRVRWEFSDTP